MANGYCAVVRAPHRVITSGPAIVIFFRPMPAGNSRAFDWDRTDECSSLCGAGRTAPARQHVVASGAARIALATQATAFVAFLRRTGLRPVRADLRAAGVLPDACRDRAVEPACW